jgi:hypothetical protein
MIIESSTTIARHRNPERGADGPAEVPTLELLGPKQITADEPLRKVRDIGKTGSCRL